MTVFHVCTVTLIVRRISLKTLLSIVILSRQFEKGKPIEYGLFEQTDLFIGPFYVKQTLEQLIELDKLITERRFIFKLKGFHKTPANMAGFFLVFFLISIHDLRSSWPQLLAN